MEEEFDDDLVECEICEQNVIAEALCSCHVHRCEVCCLTEQKFEYLEEDEDHPNGIKDDD